MVVAASGTAIMFALPALAQAPATAQVWDVRFVVDSTGPFAAGPTATQVGITMFARVGILPGAYSTNNFGVSRVGGQSGVCVLQFRDATAELLLLGQGRLDRGETVDVDGRPLTDPSGAMLAGHFAPFRGSFGPQVGPLYLGANTDPNNGVFANPAAGPVSVTQILGSRTVNFGSEGTGPIGAAVAVDAEPTHLVGDLAPIYRLYYLPTSHVGAARSVSVQVSGMSARYLVFVTGLPTASAAVPLPDQTFTFMVPAPGAGALMVLAGCAWRRRRTG